MHKIFNSITEMIGNTPMLKTNNLKQKLSLKANIFAKCEFINTVGRVNSEIVPIYFAVSLKISLVEDAWRRFIKCFIPNKEPIEPKISIIGYFTASRVMSIFEE